MNIPKNLLYTKTHEWVEEDGDTMKVGLTEHATEQLGDLVFINLPEVGDSVEAEGDFGDVESVKAVSDVLSPATGEVTAVNETALDSPEAVNADPYGVWLAQIGNITAKRELLSPEEYEKLLEEEA